MLWRWPWQEGDSCSLHPHKNWTRVEAPFIPETVDMQADEEVQQNLVLTSEILALEYGWKSAAAVDVVQPSGRLWWRPWLHSELTVLRSNHGPWLLTPRLPPCLLSIFQVTFPTLPLNSQYLIASMSPCPLLFYIFMYVLQSFLQQKGAKSDIVPERSNKCGPQTQVSVLFIEPER